MGKLYDDVHSYGKGTSGRWLSIKFVSIPDGVQLVLDSSTYEWFGGDVPMKQDGELNKIEGSEISADDLGWTEVRKNRWNGEV